MSLIDWQFFHSLTLDKNHRIEWTAFSISVYDLETATHQINEYVTLNVYLLSVNRQTAHIVSEFYLVNDLKVNMLVRTDILTAEKVTVRLQSKKLTAVIESCQNITILLSVTTRFNTQINRTVTSNEYIMISSHSQIAVFITLFSEVELLNNRDLLFQFNNINTSFAVYAYIMNHIMSEVLIYNESDKSVILPQKTHSKQIVEYEADSCYSAHSDSLSLTATNHWSKHSEN